MSEKEDRKVKILIVDDEEHFSKSLSLILRKKGFNIELAFSFSEALEKAKEYHFNIALVDIKLQGKSGVELVKPLKEIDPDIAIMMITGHASITTAIESVNLEISAYFTKPLEMNIFLKTISEALKKQSLEIRNKELIIQIQKELEERKKADLALRKSEELYRTVFEATGTAMLLIKNRKVVVCNAKFLEVFGYTREEIEGKTWVKCIVEPDRNRLLEISTDHQKNPDMFPLETEFRLTRKDGEVRTVFAVFDLVPGTLKTVASIQDITMRKNLEEAKNQAYQQLERNMEQFAILVDSIRNPLAVIVGFVDIYPEDVTKEIVKQVKLIDNIISELDLRFLESLNVRNFLKKYT